MSSLQLALFQPTRNHIRLLGKHESLSLEQFDCDSA